jgi:hypothetical protein
MRFDMNSSGLGLGQGSDERLASRTRRIAPQRAHGPATDDERLCTGGVTMQVCTPPGAKAMRVEHEASVARHEANERVLRRPRAAAGA